MKNLLNQVLILDLALPALALAAGSAPPARKMAPAGFGVRNQGLTKIRAYD